MSNEQNELPCHLLPHGTNVLRGGEVGSGCETFRMRKSQVDIWRKRFPHGGTSMCKGPQAGPGPACWRYNKEARVAGSEGAGGVWAEGQTKRAKVSGVPVLGQQQTLGGSLLEG